jgi:hypothetical protein
MDMLLFFRTIWRTSCRTLRRPSAASLIALLLVGWSGAANALWALHMVPGVYIPQMYYKHGAVYTRAIVLSPAGKPYYVEYDNSGNEGREIAEKTGQYERAQIMAGAYYRSLLQRLADTKERYPEHEEITAAAYRSSSFKTVAGETILKPSISPNALTVLVRAQNNRYLKDGSDLLLLELPIKSAVQPSASSKSLLVSEAGDILHQTENTIAFRVGFFGKDGKVETTKRRDHNSEIYGKMPSVPLSLGGHIGGGFAITDADGKYSMNYFLPACPGFTFEYTTPVYLELYYSRFNPRGSSMMPYYLVRQDYDYCNGLSALSMWATLAMTTSATFIKPKFDFPVDLMVVDGAAAFANVKLDAQTAYNPETSDYAKTIQEAYDFDGDEKPEIIVPGNKVKKTIDGEEREVFVETAVADAELQGIYLSSRHSAKPASTEETAPDFTRLIDTTADFKDRGMLQSITSEDLRDTDIYVFRESTGQLVAERRGLHENELYKTFSGVDDKQGSFRFTIQLRGSAENTYALSGRNGEANFNKWQSAGGFTEEFQKRTANHLKSGEQVRIIAINRPTGYMGSTRINLNASLNGNMIDLNQARIQLTPPNLKIWAERKNKIEQGMTSGEEKKQLIGNEGAGLGSDISIAIYSDWRDQDGGPLPEALADFGYTGRLAKIVAANQLAPVGANNLSQFKIKPGQQVQVIQLPEKVLAKQHLYLQVAGQPENRNPDFATGNGQGILKYRPSKYVPVQVPLHDEQASEIARQAYRKADKEHPELNLKKPEPMYSWQYRPEMQFSLYELNVKEVRRVDAQELSENIYQDKIPTLTSSDRYMNIIYDLLKSSLGTLETWSYQGEQELVLAIGEEEVKATVGASQNIKFENLEYLGSLDADDFLSLRLYANNDTGNLLFEYAFEYLSLDSTLLGYNNQTDDTWYVTADDPKVELQTILAGYANRDPKIKKPLTLSWKVEGAGSLTTQLQNDSDLGVFPNLLTMPVTAGSTAVVKALLRESQTEAQFKKVVVLPGKPAVIDIKAVGKAAAMESDKLQITVTVKDAHGNLVADGTSVNISVNQDTLVPEYNPGTLNGVATATLTGNAFASPDAKMTVRAGDITEVFDFAIEGLTVDIESASTSFVANRQETLQVKVTTHSGKPAADVLVTVSSDLGYFKESQYQTDANGIITAVFNTGPTAGNGTLKARAGFAGGTEQDFNVRHLGGGAQADVRDVMVLGDRAGGGSVTYNRYDGTAINLDYQTQGELKVAGQAGETVQVRIGDLTDPNLEPLLAYYMNGLEDVGPDESLPDRVLSDVPDELGLHKGTGLDIQVVTDHPLGRGSSYQFDGNSRIELVTDSTLQKPGQTGFRIDFKAEESGQILNLGGGQRLVLTGNRLRYEIETDTGQYSVEKDGISLNQWHSVGGRYANGQLELEVDGVSVASAASGAVQYSANKLLLGQGYKGRLNSFRLYDWAAQPLVQLAGGGQSRSLTLPSGGNAALIVESTGQLGALQSGSALRTLRVAVTVDGVRQYVSVLSSQGYIALAGQYLETFSSAAPPINVAGLSYRPMPWYAGLTIAPLDYMVPKAYAAEESSAWGFIKGAVNFLFPLEDFKILGEQLYYMATGDWEKFDAMELSFAALSVATVIPVMKPLKFVLDPLKKFIRQYGSNPIVKALAGVLGRATEEAVKGRTEKIISLLPYFLIVVEMLESPEGPAAIAAMVEAIESPDDLWAWIEYFNLPTDGWEGDQMPSVAYVPTNTEVNTGFGLAALDLFITPAHASRKWTPRRVAGAAIAKVITQVAVKGETKNISALFKELVVSLRRTEASKFRPMAHMGEFASAGLGLLKRAGVNTLRSLLVPKKDDRVSRKTLVAAIAYIEAQLKAGELGGANDEIRLALATLYADAFIAKTESGRHGGTFQLLNVAYYQVRSEAIPDEPVFGVEVTYPIQFRTEQGKNLGKPYGRRVDIVLGSSAKQRWVEVKSLKEKYNISRFGTGKSGEYHREYYGDLLAKYRAIEGVTVDFDWWFHSFKNTLQSSPSPAEFARYNLEEKLCATSTNKALGSPLKIISKSSSELKDACRGLNNIKLQTEGAILIELLKSSLFSQAFKESASD